MQQPATAIRLLDINNRLANIMDDIGLPQRQKEINFAHLLATQHGDRQVVINAESAAELIGFRDA